MYLLFSLFFFPQIPLAVFLKVIFHFCSCSFQGEWLPCLAIALPFPSQAGWMTVFCYSHLRQGGWLPCHAILMLFPSQAGWMIVLCYFHLKQGGWLPWHVFFPSQAGWMISSVSFPYFHSCFLFPFPLFSFYCLGSELRPLRCRWTPNVRVSGLNSGLLDWEVSQAERPLRGLYPFAIKPFAICHLLSSPDCYNYHYYYLLLVFWYLLSRCWSNQRAAKDCSVLFSVQAKVGRGRTAVRTGPNTWTVDHSPRSLQWPASRIRTTQKAHHTRKRQAEVGKWWGQGLGRRAQPQNGTFFLFLLPVIDTDYVKQESLHFYTCRAQKQPTLGAFSCSVCVRRAEVGKRWGQGVGCHAQPQKWCIFFVSTNFYWY